jgi:hypothetical protein
VKAVHSILAINIPGLACCQQTNKAETPVAFNQKAFPTQTAKMRVRKPHYTPPNPPPTMKKQLLKRRSSMPLAMAMISIAAFPSRTAAQIVYTNPEPDLQVILTTAGGTSYSLDLNKDSIADVIFSAVWTNVNTRPRPTIQKSVRATSSGGSHLIMVPSTLNASFLVPNAEKTNGIIDASRISWRTMTSGILRQSTPSYGEWTDPADRILAIRIPVNGNWHYGWVRLSVNVATNVSFTIRDYAFNGLAGQSILAGEKSCTAAPGVSLTADGPLSFCDGESVLLNAVSDSAYLLQWYKDGLILQGFDSTVYQATISGSYRVRADNSCGHAYSKADTVSVYTVDASITVSGNTLRANATDAAFKWMDCTTRQLIPGATAQTYVPSDNRLYAVIVSQNGCSDTSSCYAVNTTGIRQNAFTSSLSVYPNPATHQLSINLGQTTAKIRVTITDATGKVTYDHLVNDTQKIDVPTGDFRSGIYVVRIQTGDHTAVRSVVVSN